MFTVSEIDRITTEFKEKQKERNQQLKKIWGYLLILTIGLIVASLLIFPNQFSSETTAWILPTYGSMILATTLIGYLVSINYISEKPVYEYLYNEVIEKINMHEGMFLAYTAYDKEVTRFNKTGGLFTRYCNVKVKRHTKGDTENHHQFNIYDCTLSTSSGNSSQTHFNGVYITLHKRLNTSLQVRSHGAPKLKGVKFNKLQDVHQLRVYKPLEQELSNTDRVYITFMNKLYESGTYKRVYLSIVEDAVHIALVFVKHPTRKCKNITIQAMNKVAAQFMDEYHFVNELAALDSY